MSHPALPRIESGLAGARAALVQGDLEAMHGQLAATLDALAEVTQAGFVPRQQRAEPAWDAQRALQLVWDLLARFHAAGCTVFPYAGTLLGIEREGRLLASDKDADLAVWLEDYGLAGRLLAQWGLQRATDVPPFANVSTYVDPRGGCSVDLYGLRRDPMRQCTEGGAWLYGRPPSHQRLLVLPWFDLAPRSTPAGVAWWPEDPDMLLTAVYGDWRTPQPEWDALVSNLALHELNLGWRCWALRSLCNCWLTGELARTRRLLARVVERGGEDAALRRWREALEATQ
jgi:hypothetical protein